MEVDVYQNIQQLDTIGVTGTVIWKASYYFVKFVMYKKDWFINNSILELGSGTGFLAFAIYKITGRNVKITCSDQDHVINLLNKNIIFNKCTEKVRSAELNWEHIDLNINSVYKWIKNSFDLIIVSDCVYSELGIKCLIKTLNSIFKYNKGSFLIISMELRCHELHAIFLEAILETFTIYRSNNRSIFPPNIVLYIGWLKNN